MLIKHCSKFEKLMCGAIVFHGCTMFVAEFFLSDEEYKHSTSIFFISL